MASGRRRPAIRLGAAALLAIAAAALLALPAAARPNPFHPYATLEELRDAVRAANAVDLHARQATTALSRSAGPSASRTGTLVTITAAPTTTTPARVPVTPPPGVSPLPGITLTRRDQGVFHRFDFRQQAVHRFYIDLADDGYPCAETEMQIADQGCAGDQYNLYLDGVLMGRTTEPGGQSCSFTNPINGTFYDMTRTPDANIFPGFAWDTEWSSGRFIMPNNFHVLEIELAKRGDGTLGAFNFYTNGWGCRQQDITGAVTEEWHSSVLLNQDIHVWPNVPGLVWDINVPSGRCMNLTAWDSICPGDQWNVFVDGRPAGTSSEPQVECCRFWLQQEGSREYPNFKMGWDWWDIIMPSYGGDPSRFSKITVWVPEGQHQLQFVPIGNGDGRTAYFYARLEDCPAGYEGGRFRETPHTKTVLPAPATSVWPVQTECAVGTGKKGGSIAVQTVATRTYSTWGVTPTAGPRVQGRAVDVEAQLGAKEPRGWFKLW